MWPDETLPMLHPESNYVCMPSFRFVASRVCLAKIPFFRPDMKTRRCGLIFFKCSLGDTDSKYI